MASFPRPFAILTGASKPERALPITFHQSFHFHRDNTGRHATPGDVKSREVLVSVIVLRAGSDLGSWVRPAKKTRIEELRGSSVPGRFVPPRRVSQKLGVKLGVRRGRPWPLWGTCPRALRSHRIEIDAASGVTGC